MVKKEINERLWSHNPFLITSGQTSMRVRSPSDAFYDALEIYDEKQTHEERAALGERIQAGVRENKLLEYPEDFKGTDEERKKAFPEIYDAREARDQLVTGNLGLVSDFVQRFRKSGLTYDELLHVGVIGLMRAALKFDPKKGAYSTIAYWWMQQTIVREEENTVRRIRLPNHIDFAMRRVMAKRKDHPGITDEEILEQVDIKPRDLEAATEAIKDVWSLDLPLDSELDTGEALTFGSRLVGIEEPGYAAVEADMLRSDEHVRTLADTLKPAFNGSADKAAYVIVRRVLGLAEPKTVADELGVTTNEVNSLKNKAFNYLKSLGEDVVLAALDPVAYEAKYGTTEVEMPVREDPEVRRKELRKARDLARKQAA